MRWLTLGCSLLLTLLGGLPALAGANGAIDEVTYADDQAASAAWQPMDNTAKVSLADIQGRHALAMPCHFNGMATDRASWDRAVQLDLTAARGLEFEFFCPDSTPIATFNFYLQSGGGWYATRFGATSSQGWNRIRIDKSDMGIEGRPAGWAKVRTIRISAWRAQNENTVFYIRNLRYFGNPNPVLVVVRGESVAASEPDELTAVIAFSAAVAHTLDDLGLGYVMGSDLDVNADRLRDAKLVILPHNPKLPDATAAAIAAFLAGKGKLLAFYGLHPQLAEAVGIKSGEFMRAESGHFAGLHAIAGAALNGQPPVVGQMSWNITQALPVAGRSRTVAEWFDREGHDTGSAAIVVSDNAVQMTHVLLSDDPSNKRRLLMAMVGYLVPELWPQAAQAAIDHIGRMGPYADLTEVQAHLAPSEPLQQAIALRDQAAAALHDGRYPEAIALADKANQSIRRAYCLAQQSPPSEYRAFWCHSAFGVAGMTWDQAIKNLADNGFNAIQVNMCWGGLAYYPSTVLPVASEVEQRGDQIALCLAACRKYGVQCHVWKVNFNMGDRAPAEFAQRMKQTHRTQVDFDGKPIDQWLCPSNPENQKLEVDAMVELATKYDLDGIHFDYIRYPSPEGCFCADCRARFEKAIGQTVAHWPADVRTDASLRGKWLDFRRDNITQVVAQVSQAVRRIKPHMQISAAVFANWPADRDGVGQDWKLWCDKGYLDFVCPMDYTPNLAEFHNLVQQQIQWAGKIHCYPGIGMSTWPHQGDLFALFDQIQATRTAGTGGFTVFEYDAGAANDIVPLCGLGITKPH